MVWLRDARTLDTQGRSCLFLRQTDRIFYVWVHRDPSLHRGFHSSEELPMLVIVLLCHGQIVFSFVWK